MTTNHAADDAVARGAAILDQRIPGWVDKVSLDNLQISSCRSCVLGQLGGNEEGSYSEMLDYLTDADDDSEWPEINGFDTDYDEYSYEDLTASWKALIEQRRAEGGQ